MSGQSKPEARAYVQYSTYTKSKPKVEAIFSRTLRLLYEQLGRLEHEMFKEDKLGYDKDIARQAKELSTAVTSCGQMFFKIQEMARAAADGMTTEEQMEAVCDLVRGFGRNNRYKFWKIIHDLEHELTSADELAP